MFLITCIIACIWFDVVCGEVPVIGERTNNWNNIKKGVDFVLKCRSSSLPKPTTTWFKDSQQVYPESDPRFSYDLLTGDLTLVNPQPGAANGKYRCILTNSFGTTDLGYDLTVNIQFMGDTFRYTPRNSYFYAIDGSNTAWTNCGPPDAAPRIIPEFINGSSGLPVNSNDPRVTINIFSLAKYTMYQLIVTPATKYDTGTWSCRAKHTLGLGTLDEHFNFTLYGPPKGAENMRVTKHHLDGFVLTWDYLRNDLEFYDIEMTHVATGSKQTFRLEENKSPVIQTLTYVFTNLLRGQDYDVRMRATDLKKQVGVWSQVLRVRTVQDLAPTMILSPVSINIGQSSDALFTCVAHASPDPVFEWFRNGVLINPASSSNKYTVMQTELYSNLTIHKATPGNSNDDAQYACALSNKFGKVTSSSATLVVEWIEQTFDLAPGSRLYYPSNNFLRISARPPANSGLNGATWFKENVLIYSATFPTYRVTYYLDPSRKLTNALDIPNPGVAAQGKYSIVVRNLGGTRFVNFTLLQAGPPQAITKLSAYTTQDGKVTIQWTLPISIPKVQELGSRFKHRADIRNFELVYKSAGTSSESKISTNGVYANDQERKYDISGLKMGVKYEFKIQCTDFGSQVSPWSQWFPISLTSPTSSSSSIQPITTSVLATTTTRSRSSTITKSVTATPISSSHLQPSTKSESASLKSSEITSVASMTNIIDTTYSTVLTLISHSSKTLMTSPANSIASSAISDILTSIPTSTYSPKSSKTSVDLFSAAPPMSMSILSSNSSSSLPQQSTATKSLLSLPETVTPTVKSSTTQLLETLTLPVLKSTRSVLTSSYSSQIASLDLSTLQTSKPVMETSSYLSRLASESTLLRTSMDFSSLSTNIQTSTSSVESLSRHSPTILNTQTSSLSLMLFESLSTGLKPSVIPTSPIMSSDFLISISSLTTIDNNTVNPFDPNIVTSTSFIPVSSIDQTSSILTSVHVTQKLQTSSQTRSSKTTDLLPSITISFYATRSQSKATSAVTLTRESIKTGSYTQTTATYKSSSTADNAYSNSISNLLFVSSSISPGSTDITSVDTAVQMKISSVETLSSHPTRILTTQSSLSSIVLSGSISASRKTSDTAHFSNKATNTGNSITPFTTLSSHSDAILSPIDSKTLTSAYVMKTSSSSSATILLEFTPATRNSASISQTSSLKTINSSILMLNSSKPIMSKESTSFSMSTIRGFTVTGLSDSFTSAYPNLKSNSLLASSRSSTSIVDKIVSSSSATLDRSTTVPQKSTTYVSPSESSTYTSSSTITSSSMVGVSVSSVTVVPTSKRNPSTSDVQSTVVISPSTTTIMLTEMTSRLSTTMMSVTSSLTTGTVSSTATESPASSSISSDASFASMSTQITPTKSITASTETRITSTSMVTSSVKELKTSESVSMLSSRMKPSKSLLKTRSVTASSSVSPTPRNATVPTTPRNTTKSQGGLGWSTTQTQTLNMLLVILCCYLLFY